MRARILLDFSSPMGPEVRIGHRVPGEHGFRFFPGFYKHVIDTMRRIPSFDGAKVADHLVPTTRLEFTQYDKPPFLVPAGFPLSPRDAGTIVARHPAGARAERRPHPRRPGVLRRAPLADPHLVQGAPARGVRADELVGLRRRRGAVGALPEVPCDGHNALAGGRQGAHRPARAPSATSSCSWCSRSSIRSGDRPTVCSTGRRTSYGWIHGSSIWNRAACSTSGTRRSRKSCASSDASPASSLASKGSAPWCVATIMWQRCRSRTWPPW